MTNDDIIKIVLTITVSIVSAFSKSLFDRILAEYKPDIKKMKSRIIFLVLILFRFIIPFIVLIVLYFKTENIDKIFVVSFSSISFILIFNIFYDFFLKYVNKKHETQLDFQKHTYELISNLIETIKKNESNNNEKFSEIIEITKLQKQLFDLKIEQKAPNR